MHELRCYVVTGASLPKASLPKESWRALACVGVLFPLHIVLGVLSIPFLLYQVASGSRTALAFLVLYLPCFLYPAQRRFPGWKGFESFWRLMDYTRSCPSYFGESPP